MQFSIPAATKKRTKYFPRHFQILADYFHGLQLGELPPTLEPHRWTIVVRSPGYQGLSRATAAPMGIDCAFDLLSSEEIATIKQQNGRILLDLGWEMLNPLPNVVVGLAETLKELGLDSRRIFIFHSNQNARQTFTRSWIDLVGTPPPLGLEFPVAMALCVVHHQKGRNVDSIRQRKMEAGERTSESRRSRLFNSFNGEVRPHRLYMAAAFQNLGLLDRGYFSLIYPRKSAKETEDQFRMRSLKLIRKFPRGNELERAAREILEMLPLELDLGALPKGGVEEIAWVSQDPVYYDDSRFSVVIDTAVSDSDSLFVTEKVLKPIINHSPFLLVGSAGGANLLRSFGFRTFEPHIRQCESGGYEDVIQCAVEEVARLSRLSESELDALSRALAETCDYNAAQFWTSFPLMLKHKFDECLLALGPEAGVLE
jgi:hypothetical protein